MQYKENSDEQTSKIGPFERQRSEEAKKALEEHDHLIREGVICGTEDRGFRNPGNQDPRRIVVDAPDGFLVLWAKDTILRYRYQQRALAVFADPTAVRQAVEALLGEAILRWGDAAPVTFQEARPLDAWDFEIVVRDEDDCDAFGCVLASAFFPDAGRHQLTIYPRMFEQSPEEQVETLIHELGHVFGLRHFFAEVSEQAWPSEIFGTHNKFTIMNYGANSQLTQADKDDLKRLYWLAWSGELTNVNGTPIRFVHPYHTLRERSEGQLTNTRPLLLPRATGNGASRTAVRTITASSLLSDLPPLAAFPALDEGYSD